MNIRRHTLKRLQSFTLLFSLIIQQFLPVAAFFQSLPVSTVYAAEVDQVSSQPDSLSTPQVSTEEAKIETNDQSVEKPKETTDEKVEASPTLVKEANKNASEEASFSTPEPSPEIQEWIEKDGVFSTIETVELEKEYKAPQNDKVVVRFTKLPEKPGKLSIQEIKLTPEQVNATQALSDTAYDITSDMENGSFEYDLTLPLPEGTGSNTKIIFAQDIEKLSVKNFVAVDDEKVEIEQASEKVLVNDLNHFTIFVVTSFEEEQFTGTDSGYNGIWFTNGDGVDVERVPSGTHGVTSSEGSYHAEITGSSFTRWDGYKSSFPNGGYDTRVDVYLDMSLADGSDKRFDFSSAINGTDGNHRRDFIFHLGTDPSNSGQWRVSASNNAPGNFDNAPLSLDETGWYTLEHQFRQNGDNELEVTLNIYKAGESTPLGSWVRHDASDVIGSTVGGNRYGWFTGQRFDLDWLAVDNSRIEYTNAPIVTVVTPSNLQGWSEVTAADGEVNFIDYSAAPRGTGVLQLITGSENASRTRLLKNTNVPLQDVHTLKYQSRQIAGPAVANAAFVLGIDIDNNGTQDASLIYEPYYNGTVTTDWQEWNVRAGKFWSNTTVGSIVSVPAGSYASNFTLDQVLAWHPNTRIVNFGVNMGTWNPSWEILVDNIQIGSSQSNEIFDFEPSTVLSVCKEDENGNRLEGWTMNVVEAEGQTHQFTTAEVQSTAGYSISDLPAGNYLVEISGYYRYGNSQMIADAGYSYRPDNIPCSNVPGEPNPWVSGGVSCMSNMLSLRINDTVQDWGPFNASHIYQTMVTHSGSGSLKFNITDDGYGDNSNSTDNPLTITLRRVAETQETTENGCAQFGSLPTGEYLLQEEMQPGWEHLADHENDTVPVGGLIDLSLEPVEYVFVNRNNNPEPTFQVTGMKFNDRNGDGMRDEGEGGLSDWTIKAARFVETVNVDSRNINGNNTVANLPAGEYYLRVNGTWRGDSNSAHYSDAEYVTFSNWAANQDGTSLGANQKDLMINNDFVDWGAFDSGHTYYHLFNHSAGGPLNLSVFDGDATVIPAIKNSSWYGDNSGTLSVDVYQVVETTTTDEDGNYQFEFPEDVGDVIIFEVQQPGWEQTAPAANFCTVSAAQNEPCLFGNKQTPVPPELTVCKEDPTGERLSGWTMHLTEEGPTHTFTDEEVQSNVGYTFADLPAGEYLVKVDGYYDYGTEAMISDAGYSYRPEGIRCSISGSPWVDNGIPCISNYLSVQINETVQDWGEFKDDHSYQTVVTHSSSGPLKVNITDDNYGDNSNSTNNPLTVSLYRIIESQVTSEELEGCAVFSDVEAGNYVLYEEMQLGWQNLVDHENNTVPPEGQIEVTSGSTEYVFVNEYTPPPFIVTGAKFNDLDGDGVRDEGENGLPNWTIGAARYVETVNVDTTQLNGSNTVATLPAGNYYLKVSGTWRGSADPNGLVDAEYVTPDSWATYSDGSVTYGLDQGDLLVNYGGPSPATPGTVDWGSYNTSHTYYKMVSHSGGQMNLSVFDGDTTTMTKNPGWYGDNLGSLAVEVFQVIGTTTTDSNGDYQLDLPTDSGEVIVFEVQQTGWMQTTPVTNYCTVSVANNTPCVFGNTVLSTPSPSVSPSPSLSPDPSSTPSATVTPSPAPNSESSRSSGGDGGGGGGPVANNAQPPVCTDSVPGGAPVVTVVSTGTNTVTLSWTAVSPVTHYALSFRRNSDNEEYGAPNIGNVTSYTITNLSGQDSYTFEIFGVNNCAPGDRGSATSGQVGGVIIPDENRPLGADGQVLGVSEEVGATPSPAPENGEESNNPSVLGATDCTTFPWWWVPVVVYAIVVVAMAFIFSNNHAPRRIITLLGFAISGLLLYFWKCDPWLWILGTGIGGGMVEFFTTFLMSDDEHEPPKHAPKEETPTLS